jgi:hypothetical protein
MAVIPNDFGLFRIQAFHPGRRQILQNDFLLFQIFNPARLATRLPGPELVSFEAETLL